MTIDVALERSGDRRYSVDHEVLAKWDVRALRGCAQIVPNLSVCFMPNGFMGSTEEWRELEAPYVRIDPILRAFAQRHALAVRKNYRDADRSLQFNDAMNRAIWVNAADSAASPATFDVSVLAHQDRPDRFIKAERVAKEVPVSQLEKVLELALDQVSSWTDMDLEGAYPDEPKRRVRQDLEAFLSWFFDPFHDGRTVPAAQKGHSRYADGRRALPDYTEPLEYYEELYNRFLASSAQRLPSRDSELITRQRMHGTLGLIARGAEAIPYAVRLLGNAIADAREDAATILAEPASAPGAVEALLAALRAESDTVVRKAIIYALGSTRSHRALEALEALDTGADVQGDTRETIARSLERLRRAVT